jgi:hypothetical protein
MSPGDEILGTYRINRGALISAALSQKLDTPNCLSAGLPRSQSTLWVTFFDGLLALNGYSSGRRMVQRVVEMLDCAVGRLQL